MSDVTDLFGPSIEPIPGLPYTRKVVDVCRKRADMLRTLERHTGFKTIETMWRRWRAEGRIAAQMATPEDWRQGVARINALAAIEDIIGEYGALADFFETHVAPERRAVARADFTESSAAAALRDAEAVRDMAQLPGWAIFMRDLGARVRALASLLTLCSEGERTTILGVMGALTTALMAPKQILDLGMDAEAWQRAQLEALERKGKE